MDSQPSVVLCVTSHTRGTEAGELWVWSLGLHRETLSQNTKTKKIRQCTSSRQKDSEKEPLQAEQFVAVFLPLDACRTVQGVWVSNRSLVLDFGALPTSQPCSLFCQMQGITIQGSLCRVLHQKVLFCNLPVDHSNVRNFPVWLLSVKTYLGTLGSLLRKAIKIITRTGP
jgi:hypothetical protein